MSEIYEYSVLEVGEVGVDSQLLEDKLNNLGKMGFRIITAISGCLILSRCLTSKGKPPYRASSKNNRR